MNIKDAHTSAFNSAQAIAGGGFIKLVAGAGQTIAQSIIGVQLPNSTSTITINTSIKTTTNTDAQNIDGVTFEGPGEFLFPAKTLNVDVVGICLLALA